MILVLERPNDSRDDWVFLIVSQSFQHKYPSNWRDTDEVMSSYDNEILYCLTLYFTNASKYQRTYRLGIVVGIIKSIRPNKMTDPLCGY